MRKTTNLAHRRHRPQRRVSSRENQRTLAFNSMLTERLSIIAGLGMGFGGKRDIYTEAGYKKLLTYEDFYGAYRRQDVARRVVRAPADESWRKAPEILDGSDPDTARDDTEFVKAWNQLANGTGVGDKPEGSRGLLHYLSRADRISGIGRYGLLYLGARDGEAPDQPLKKGALNGPDDLLFVGTYAEGNAAISTSSADRSNERYTLPEHYNLTVTGATTTSTLRAHWTRCIHIAEDLENDDIYGQPRLEACWNRIYDLLKIMAGSGEAAWKLLDTGHILTTKPGQKLPSKASDLTDLEDQVEEFVHGLRRWLLAEGLESTGIEGTVTDPTGLVNINVALISAATGIPQRILLGSERGELASSQDEVNWANVIATRQQNHVGPMILRPLINRLIWAGALPKPSSGGFCIYWPPLVESRREETSMVARNVAMAFRTLGIEVDPQAFVATYANELPGDAVAKRAEPPPPKPGTSGPQPGEPDTDPVDPNGNQPSNDSAPATNAEGGDGTLTGVPFRGWTDYP